MNPRAHKKLTTAIAGVLAVLAIGGTAYAATAAPNPHHVYNRPAALMGPGATIPLETTCERLPMSIRPAGHTVASLKAAMFAGDNIYQQQIKCLIRRSNRMARCWDAPVPTVTVYHGDDWKANNLADATKGIDTAGPDGVDALQAYIAAVRSCTLGTS